MRRILIELFFAVILVKLFGVNSQSTTTNPAFENIAPCGCDMTMNQYDNNCCCDPDMSNQLVISNCISGPFGGNFTTVDDRLCRSDQSFTPDWFPFTCILFLNSPSLGLYYYPSTEPGATVTANLYSYDPDVTTATTSLTCIGLQYVYGDIVFAQFGSTPCRQTSLTFPQISTTGFCARKSPVRYLVDTTASCDVSVSESSCASGTILGSASYTDFSDIATSPENVAPSVVFNCSTSSNAANFIKTNAGTAEQATESLFPQTSTSGVTACSSTDTVLDGTTCRNAVATVSYIFTWNASRIVGLNVEITLVDVDLTTGPSNILTQQFTTTYVHVNAATLASQSGFPGYEFGFSVKSATDSGLTLVNTTEQLTIWTPTTSGLCADATRTAPSFGYDIITGCTLVFGFRNCSTLREDVENNQLELVIANRVSRFGNPTNTASAADWIPVVSNISGFVEENVTAGQCEGIPSHVVIEFLWAITGYGNNGDAIREIVGARTSLIRETWEIKCIEGETSCNLNTYAIYSSVIFTEVPAQPSTPLTSYEINRNDTCKKDATCWPELLLPIQPEFFYLFNATTADMLRSYNYGWTLIVTFASIAAVVVPAHWSSVGRYLRQVLPV